MAVLDFPIPVDATVWVYILRSLHKLLRARDSRRGRFDYDPRLDLVDFTPSYRWGRGELACRPRPRPHLIAARPCIAWRESRAKVVERGEDLLVAPVVQRGETRHAPR